jgi:hypothetical protein
MDIGARFEYMLATGNLQTSTGLDLMQVSGYTITAEKLNYFRYLSHFRSIHRGSFFAELRTTEVRKLLPESWGFFCPVHTPDGSPCGLLNHLTYVSPRPLSVCVCVCFVCVLKAFCFVCFPNYRHVRSCLKKRNLLNSPKCLLNWEW